MFINKQQEASGEEGLYNSEIDFLEKGSWLNNPHYANRDLSDTMSLIGAQSKDPQTLVRFIVHSVCLFVDCLL